MAQPSSLTLAVPQCLSSALLPSSALLACLAFSDFILFIFLISIGANQMELFYELTLVFILTANLITLSCTHRIGNINTMLNKFTGGK